MDFAFLIIRLVLSAIFLVAAMAKLVKFDEAKDSVRQFGVPASISGQFLACMIVCESIIAFLFIFSQTSRPSGIAASLLLLVFSAAIIRVLVNGVSAQCNCFGGISQRPVGIFDLARNLVLILLAILVAVTTTPGYDFIASNTGTEMTDVLLAAAIFGLFALGIALLVLGLDIRRGNVDLSRRMDLIEKNSLLVTESASLVADVAGLPVGTPVPNVILRSAAGLEAGADELFSKTRPTFVIFVGPNCVPCGNLSKEIQAWRHGLKEMFDIALITNGSVEDNIAKFGQYSLDLLQFQKGQEVSEKFLAKWTPAALVLGPNGRIASNTVIGDAGIRDLADDLAEVVELKMPLWVCPGMTENDSFGKSIPQFNLSYVNGSKFASSEISGREALVLFWSLTCSYCTELIPEIKQWAKERNDYRLIVLADGDLEELDSTGLGDVLIHDPGYRFSRQMGMSGTPSAVRIDSNGIIASETAAGAVRIRLLAGRKAARE
jgi:thiol-disulfide isomerase/thioredoxin/uncharacterized membrane protein YphA (DoxX/SURF4 family)